MTMFIKPMIIGALLLAIPAEAVLLYTKIQEATVATATAANAERKQGGEAELYSQTARTQLQIAINAAELKKAEADAMFAEARKTEAVALNAREPPSCGSGHSASQGKNTIRDGLLC